MDEAVDEDSFEPWLKHVKSLAEIEFVSLAKPDRVFSTPDRVLSTLTYLHKAHDLEHRLSTEACGSSNDLIEQIMGRN